MKENAKKYLIYLAIWIIFYPLLFLVIPSNEWMDPLFIIYAMEINILIMKIIKS